MTGLARLERLQDDIHGAYGMWGADDLADACAAAAGVQSFGGSPETLRHIAKHYSETVWLTAQQAYHVIYDMQERGIDGVWTGDTKVSANDALRALMHDLCRALEVIRMLGTRLQDHAGVLEANLGRDAADADDLRDVAARARELTMLGFVPNPLTYDGAEIRDAHARGMYAIDGRVAAHIGMRHAAADFTAFAHDMASQARAGRFSGSPLSTVDELVIAEAGMNIDNAHEAVLTAAMDERAAAALNRMTDADRRQMTELLAAAASPEQRAYLLKALAAGYSVDDIARFDAMIAAHGADPAWLDQHLSPLAMDGGYSDGKNFNAFGGELWTQGNHPTCVASSTVAARAEVDPLYALQLTTGGHPDDPAFDNPDAFAHRLRDEQVRVYDGGRNWWQDLWHSDGMTDGQSKTIANEEIAPHTGTRYDSVEMKDERSRETTMRAVERAVDDGYPVPIVTREGSEGHQMLVIGHSGDRLQIYNPWGYTYWVTEDEFVAGHVDGIDPDIPSTPTSVRLPQGVAP
jgi:hypothetical protein